MKNLSPVKNVPLAVTVSLLMVAGGLVTAAAAAAASTTPTLDLQVLLIGEGASDPATAAWESALTTEGVPYTEVDASGTAPSQSVALPTLYNGDVGNFNGIVLAGSPTDFASGALDALYSYESTFGVDQLDGYMYPDPNLGATVVSSGALDGTTGTLTTAGLAIFPALAGPVPFGTGTYGYAATATAGAPFTPLITDASGNVLAGIYQHPSTGDPQAGVAELSLFFNYSATQLQWLLLAPGLINWVTRGTHLGLYRNYVEMDIDDTFTPDDAWDTTTHEDDYSNADSLRMTPVDVIDAAEWSQANNFRLDQLFNFGSTAAYQEGDLQFAGDTSEGADGSPDPLLAEFQATDLSTGKPYADDFGWISHTYDTPYLDVGCATQDYIEAELNENTTSIAAAPGATAGTGGLGITDSTDDSLAYGAEDPQVFVPGNHSGLADLVPGTPSTVDPPDLDTETVGTGGTLAADTYQYAVTDQFTADSSAGQSEAYVTDPITVPAGGTVTLQWQAICHAANYLVYREVAGSNDWTLIGNFYAPSSAVLPDNSSGDANPPSTTDVTGAGEQELDYTDSGSGGCQGDSGYCVSSTAEPAGWVPPTTEGAQESPWEQNPYFIPGLEAVGITAVGSDASKPYPNPPDDQFGIGATYSGPEYAAGDTFLDGTAQVVPRHPINVFYDASTEAQEVDEYNTLYLSTADGGTCTGTSNTTCITSPYTFADIVNSVVDQMLQYMLSNNPDPSYVHQTNLIGVPPSCTTATTAGSTWPNCDPAPTAGTPPATAETAGDGLLYSVLDPLLADYHSYFSSATPYEQLTEGQIGTVLADQSAWSTALSGTGITASENDGVVTVTNSGTSPMEVPLTLPTGSTYDGAAFGQSYGGALSDWLDLAGGSSATLTESVPPAIVSPASATSNVGAPFSYTVYTTGEPAPALTESGALPAGLTFVDNGNGTATISGTSTSGSGGTYPFTVTASSTAGTVTQDFVLTNTQAPTITSPAAATFTTGFAGTYNITTTGFPPPTLTDNAATLPSGLTFLDNGNGTGSISGTPATGTAGSYPVTLQATNSSGSTATLDLAITVDPATAPTLDLPVADFTLNQLGSVAVSATGFPTPLITETGALPAGLSFVDNGNGTGLLSGTPTATGTTDITMTASNGVSPDATETWAIVVGQAPAFTSADTALAAAGTPFSFTLTTSGYPAPSIGASGLPSDLSFVDNGNGTATISGTPSTADIGDYSVSLTATSEAGSASQAFSLAVGELPSITSAASASFSVGTAGSFSVTTTGSPTASLSETGALPSGATFVDNGNGSATLAGAPAAGTSGSWPFTVTAKNSVGSTAQSFTLFVDQPPSFTSGSSAAVNVGSPLSFTVSASGYPTPFISTTSALPTGVTLTDNGNGTATLSGTPAASSTGSWPLTLSAENSSGTTTQSFTLAVNPAPTAGSGVPGGSGATPSGSGGSSTGSSGGSSSGSGGTGKPVTRGASTPAFTSKRAAWARAGRWFSFKVTTSGYPVPAIKHSALPAWLHWANDGNGAATIKGRPTVRAAGVTKVLLEARNSAGTARQTLSITVMAPPVLTSSKMPVAIVAKHFRFSVAVSGYPRPTLTESGALPAGLVLSRHGREASLSGAPHPGTEGKYHFSLTASNSVGTETTHYVLTVREH